MNWYLSVLKNYSQFNGRARRNEYWYFFLINFIISSALTFLGSLIHLTFISYIYLLAVLVPGIAVAVRRMHDVDKEWWYAFIPFYNLYLACIEGTKGENKYGPDPRNNKQNN